MSEKFTEEEIDRYLLALYAPSLPLKAIISQLRTERDELKEELAMRMIEREAMLEELGCK